MNFNEFFGDNLRAAPEPEQFETFEAWAWRLISEERLAIESLVRESLRERPAAVDAPSVPPLPDAMASNDSIRAAWAAFNSAPHRSGSRTPVGPPRFTRRVGDDDPSGWPENLR